MLNAASYLTQQRGTSALSQVGAFRQQPVMDQTSHCSNSDKALLLQRMKVLNKCGACSGGPMLYGKSCNTQRLQQIGGAVPVVP
jgi:hypothetical protein